MGAQLHLWYSSFMLDQPPKRGEARDRLIKLAEQSVLEKGFASTSIEELIVAAGITKSGFFYHFKDKSELAKALLERYIEENDAFFLDIFRRADELNDDPLHGYLVGLKLFAEMMGDLPNGHPGCLVASYCYQDRLFDPEVRELTRRGVEGWRNLFRERIERIAERYPPRIPVDFGELADMANALVDGGIILSRVMKDPDVLSRQIMLYRDFVRMIFLPPQQQA